MSVLNEYSLSKATETLGLPKLQSWTISLCLMSHWEGLAQKFRNCQQTYLASKIFNGTSAVGKATSDSGKTGISCTEPFPNFKGFTLAGASTAQTLTHRLWPDLAIAVCPCLHSSVLSCLTLLSKRWHLCCTLPACSFLQDILRMWCLACNIELGRPFACSICSCWAQSKLFNRQKKELSDMRPWPWLLHLHTLH